MANKGLSSLATSVFCENLAMMLAAGIPSDEAMDLLSGDSREGAFHDAARAVHELMEKGSTLAEAMDASGVFPAYATSSIATGEESGRTEETLRALSRYYSETDRIEKRLKSAVIYPTVLLFLVAVVLLVMVLAVLPTFTGVYESLSGDISTSTFSYIKVADVICWVALVVTLVVAFALLAMAIMARSSADGRQRVIGLLRNLPSTRRAFRQVACAQFTGTLSTYMASGINPDDAVERACKTIDHEGFANEVKGVEAEMSDGKGLATAIYDRKLFEPLYARMLISGSKSGNLENVLGELSRLFFDDAETRMTDVIDSLEPALAGFLTIVVGLSLISVMLPLVGIMGGIG